jgi:hypothetical protein
MKRRRANPRTVALAALIFACSTLACLTLGCFTGCSRQLTGPPANGTASHGQLPFERVSDVSGLSPTAGLTTDEIPAGTQFTIRLQTALSSADSRAGDGFQAVLDEPLVLAGKTIVPPGTPVAGSVIAARASESVDGGAYSNPGYLDPGYLRLTLTSMVIHGKSVPLRTSTLFVKGRSYEKGKATTIKSAATDEKSSAAELAAGDGTGTLIDPAQRDVRFSTGRRLSFRLAQPLPLSR